MSESRVGQDIDGLSVELATEAIRQLGEPEFTVFATLSSERPETIRNFGRFKDVLMMAYRRGVDDAQASR